MSSSRAQLPPWREDPNEVRFTGTLERDPEYYEHEGQARCTLLLACTRTRTADGRLVKKTIPIEVKAGGAEAERCCRALRKGARARVRGELSCITEQQADGQRRPVLVVAAREVTRLDTPRSSAPSTTAQ
jgi:single-stranded DNA-binding protein